MLEQVVHILYRRVRVNIKLGGKPICMQSCMHDVSYVYLIYDCAVAPIKNANIDARHDHESSETNPRAMRTTIFTKHETNYEDRYRTKMLKAKPAQSGLNAVDHLAVILQVPGLQMGQHRYDNRFDHWAAEGVTAEL
jgi:hypothetical protein